MPDVKDIFVSYSRSDRERVEPLVRALEGEGLSVWWDPLIEPGHEWDDVQWRFIQARMSETWLETSSGTPMSRHCGRWMNRH